ncbi:MAG: sulfite exporter TauE/SafE family protein [Candidatus Thorarchaeota archaeon]
MQPLIFEFSTIVLIAVGVGTLSAMTGISGGAFKTPILIIFFSVTAEIAAAASLLSALFVSIVTAPGYYRQNPELIELRIGSLAVIATIPGSYLGVALRTIAAHANLLHLVFGIILFPVAVKLLFAMPEDKEHANGRKKLRSFSELSPVRRVVSILAIFLAGVSAGLLGLGGGIIIVPVFCIILEFPILKAAATSLYIMIFTTTAGSIINYYVLAPTDGLSTFLYYGLAMGLGMVIGGLIGTKYASRLDAAWLQRLFGFLLIFPLVKMMRLGHMWLDPGGSDYILATIGDAIIWLLLAIPLWLLSDLQRMYIRRKAKAKANSDMTSPCA